MLKRGQGSVVTLVCVRIHTYKRVCVCVGLGVESILLINKALYTRGRRGSGVVLTILTMVGREGVGRAILICWYILYIRRHLIIIIRVLIKDQRTIMRNKQ